MVTTATWNHATPLVDPSKYGAALLPARVEGPNPADPTQDTLAQISVATIVSASAAGVAQVAQNYVGAAIWDTWAHLAAQTGGAGQMAVIFSDAGTHTDPVVGGTVSNSGFFSWSASPAGWKWFSTTQAALASAQVALAATQAGNAATSATAAAAAVSGGSRLFDRALKPDRNIFDATQFNDNTQMSAFGGAGVAITLSGLSGHMVTPIMVVSPGVTYAVPFNLVRGTYLDAAGSTVSAVTPVSIDTYNFTFTVPTGTNILYVQIQGDKGYIAAGSISRIDIHAGTRSGLKTFEMLESSGVVTVGGKVARANLPTNATLMSRIELLKDYVWSAGVLTASGGSNCWNTSKFRVDETRGFVSNQPIYLTNGGVALFDIDGNFLFNNGTTFTAVTTNGTNSINVTATTNGRPLCKGSLVDCATGGVVPGLGNSSTLYITGVPANGAALGTYTLSGNCTNSGTHADMRSGGTAANIAMIPPAGYGVAYAGLALFYYFASATPDTWNLSDGPIPAVTSASGPSAPSLSLGWPDLELLFPWYKIPMAAFGNSVTAGYFYDYFEQVTKCDLQIRAGVAATQLQEFGDGPRVISLGQTQNRNAVNGDINGPITSAAMVGIKGYTVGPLGGNEFGFSNGAGAFGNDNSSVTHRQPHPIGLVSYTAPVAVFQVAATASSTTITVSNMESGVIIPGSSCLFSNNGGNPAPYGLGGRYIASQTGVTSVTGATCSFSGTAMTVVTGGTGTFAIGQTITGANVPANTWIASGTSPNFVLNKSVGTLATQATTATNAGGNGTYLLDASTGVTTGGAVWTICGTFYGSLYWFFITKMGAMAPGAIPFMKNMYPRYDGGASNGGSTDPNNPGNPINILGNRITTYNTATLNFRDTLLHAPLIDNYGGTASTTNATAQALSADLLHPLQTRPGAGISDAGAHWYAGRVGRVVNQYSPIFT